MKLFRNRHLVKTENLICSAGSDFNKVSVDKRTCDSLGADNEDISKWDSTQEYRGLEEESNRVDHKRKCNLR
jgi:hypothetical protein